MRLQADLPTAPSLFYHLPSISILYVATAMNAGYGVGDIIAVYNLAWSVYKSCRDAPQDFRIISGEVNRLHTVLKETRDVVQDLARKERLDPKKEVQLRGLTMGCQEVLTELQELLSRFNRLGSRSRITLDRLLWSQGDVTALRERIVSNITLLGAFCNTVQMCVLLVDEVILLTHETGHRKPDLSKNSRAS